MNSTDKNKKRKIRETSLQKLQREGQLERDVDRLVKMTE